MKNLIKFVLLLLICHVSLAADYYKDTLTISSEILGESRKIILFIPSELDRSDTINLLYILDGEFAEYRFRHLSGMQDFKSLIGVGIINTDRRKELLYAFDADHFLKFISAELIPAVERNFTVHHRILYGHSFGGSFTLYAMLHMPGLFDQYIASSPTPIMDMIDSRLYLQLDSSLDKEIRFYCSHGSRDMKQVRKWCERLHSNLQEQNFSKIRWKDEVFEGLNHNNSDTKALLMGFNFW